jgi:hypothetical protein
VGDTPSGIFKRTSEAKVSLSAVVQTGLAAVIGWLLTMMLGMDARVARIEAAKMERDRVEALQLATDDRRLTKVEDANTKQWEAIRTLREQKR